MSVKYYNSDKFNTTIKCFENKTMLVARAIPWKPKILEICKDDSSEYEIWKSIIDEDHPSTEALEECEESVFTSRLGEVLTLCRKFPNE